MIINNKSEVVAIKITKGNTDDRKTFESMVTSKNYEVSVMVIGDICLKNFSLDFIIVD